MKVMTFNVRADNILDIRNRWYKRADIVYELISTYECDIIGLQEITKKMYRDLSAHIDSYDIIGEGRSKHLFHEKNNILIDKKYKILDQETFWLSSTPSKSGSSIWYSLFPRICTTAVIEMDNQQKVRVYNTHLDCLLPYAREYGLKTIISVIEKYHEKEKLPCILMGDFNANPNSRVIKQFSGGIYTSKRFVAVQDTRKELYNETTMSMFKDRKQGMHIDYIFVSEEFKIKNVEIARFNKGGKYPSDHYPIVADLKL